ncbi:ATP-binding cassette domain-containing protein [Formosa sp. S-31]|uniref:ATP-binding cassette domain-containing protein n=1 Tax=Formosa sp. S-31 TaxID=2790949 RepID=UPI003EBF4C96
MNTTRHIAFHSANRNTINQFLDYLTKNSHSDFSEFRNKKAAYFSNTTLNEFIKEELLHDDFTLTSESHRKLLTLSSGERKKALLKYLIARNPEYLILENPFDALDSGSVTALKEELIKRSENLPIIQIFSRNEDILPFINQILTLKNDVYSCVPKSDYLKKEHLAPHFILNTNIPEPLKAKKNYGSPLIAFRNVNVSYNGTPILKHINWEINAGEFWELKGENGSGKSTLVTMMIGDNPKGYGQDLFIFGNKRGSGETVWDIKQKLGYFTSSMMDLFNGHHTAINMVISGLKDSIGLYQIPTDLETDLARQWLKLIGLQNLEQTNYYYLSETQKRLILICRAMIKHPPLLILDEPTMGLDDYGASIFISLVNKIAHTTNTAILYVSHRHETELTPTHIFKLDKTPEGSSGIVMQN